MKHAVQKPTRFGELFRHRIIVTSEAEVQGVTANAIIKKVFNALPVP